MRLVSREESLVVSDAQSVRAPRPAPQRMSHRPLDGADGQLDSAVREHVLEMGFRGVLAVPIGVGNEWMGYSVVLTRAPHVFSAGEMRIYESVNDQAAIALRSARLYREAQSRARREQLIREITSKMRGTPDLDTILNTAVQELGKALGVSRAFVRLGTGSDLDTALTGAPVDRDAPIRQDEDH